MSDTQPSRSDIRDKIFSAKPKTIRVTLFGAVVELRQPPLAVILSVQEQTADDRMASIFQTMMRYVYVPGTDERVFEDADRDSFLNLPFGEDMQSLQSAITELTNVADMVKEATKN